MAVVHHLLDNLEPYVGGDFFAELAAYESRWQNIEQAIADNLLAKEHFSGKTVIIHSHSGMLTGVVALIAARVGGLEVRQTRSEPGGEGELQYRELQQNGIAVDLIDDSEVPAMAQEADTAFLGPDQYTDEYFVNKVGSGRIVESMRALGKPTFVLGDSRKKMDELHFSPEVFEKTAFDDHVILVTESGFDE
jgi:translation initiation factor 2B subunit (eIF-2B alpha/beta/delta family)